MTARILLATLILVGCEKRTPEATSAASAAESATTVDVVPIVARRLDTTARLPAEIYAYESVALYPRTSGFVDEVLVDRGSAVEKGQLLVRLSAPELTAQRSEAESKMTAARATFERTKAAAETPGAVAKNDLEMAEAAFKADEARLQSLRTLEGYLYVRAPFSGTITERNIHPGALVGPPTGAEAPMLRMESIGSLRVTVAVPETDVGAIADGAPVEFTVRTWPGVKFSGPIRRVAHAVDPRTRTMPVELDYANDDKRLAPGMLAEVSWPVRREVPSLFVPASAVAQTTDKVFVDVVKEGTVEQVTVKRGVAFNDTVEVFGDGLSNGELVLRKASEELKSGAKVTPSK